ncbi:MAG: hypothetical protein ACSHW9_09505, partial [Salinibacterium amurskyense]
RQRTQPRPQPHQGLSPAAGSAAPDAYAAAAPDATGSTTSPAAPTSVTAADTAALITVDVATDRVKTAGFHAVRAIIPGFARLQPAAFPLAPFGRLAEARETLGWDAAPNPGPYPGW